AEEEREQTDVQSQVGESAGVPCFFFQAEDGIRHFHVTGVQSCALPISPSWPSRSSSGSGPAGGVGARGLAGALIGPKGASTGLRVLMYSLIAATWALSSRYSRARSGGCSVGNVRIYLRSMAPDLAMLVS